MGVESPQGMPCNHAPFGAVDHGGVCLGCGFRQPNSETEFGASVKGIGPYGEKGRFQQPLGPTAQSGAFGVRSQGMGGDRRKGHPKRGTAAATAGAAL